MIMKRFILLFIVAVMIFTTLLAGCSDQNAENKTQTETLTKPISDLFPFSQKKIDEAVATELLWYKLGAERDARSVRSAASLFYLTAACTFDQNWKATDKTIISDRVLEHIRNVIAGSSAIREVSVTSAISGKTIVVANSTNEPGCNGALDSQGTSNFFMSIALIKDIPEVWDQLTQDEKDKITLLMKAALVSSNWCHDDDNNFLTGLDQLGNFNKGWNESLSAGSLYAGIASAYFFGGADAANEILKTFDYDTFLGQLDAAGFASTKWVFSQTDKAKLEEVTRRDDFTYRGFTFDQANQIAKSRAENDTFSKSVKNSIFDIDGETVIGFVVNNKEGLPNLGEKGMFEEFDAIDTFGGRTSMSYVARGSNFLIPFRFMLQKRGDWDMEKEGSTVNRLYEVGMTDYLYKAENGYHSYINGKENGDLNETDLSDKFKSDLIKELWLNILKPSTPTTPPPTPIPVPTNPNPQNLALNKKITGFSSQLDDTKWKAANINDGGISTENPGWSAQGLSSLVGRDEWVTIDLGQEYVISKFVFIAEYSYDKRCLKDYVLYGSSTGEFKGEEFEIATGLIPHLQKQESYTVYFTPARTRYIKFKGTSGFSKFMTVGELEIYEN